jgi:lysophospholipase L1-like esterase
MKLLAAATTLLVSCGAPTTTAPEEEEPTPPPAPTIRVTAIGDSITAGSPAFLGGWRAQLKVWAPNLEFVGSQSSVGLHEGYSGANVSPFGLLYDYALPNVDVYQPQLILLTVGTNDITGGIEDPEATLAFAEILLAKSSVQWVIVATITPRTDEEPWISDTPVYNAGLLALAPGASTGITVYNVGGCLTGADLADQVHPTQAGYLKMAAVWLQAIEAAGVPLGQ